MAGRDIDETMEFITALIPYLGVGAIGAITALAARNETIRSMFFKAAVSADNRKRLSTKSLPEIIKSAITEALDAFKKQEAERDQKAWERHDKCHEEINSKLGQVIEGQERIHERHDEVLTEMGNIKQDIGRLQGRGND